MLSNGTLLLPLWFWVPMVFVFAGVLVGIAVSQSFGPTQPTITVVEHDSSYSKGRSSNLNILVATLMMAFFILLVLL